MKTHCSEVTLVAVEELVAHPRNPNHHSRKQIKALSKILIAQGFRSPIVVSNLSGFIVAGHGRLEAAKLAGFLKVPVDYQDFENEAMEWAHLIADNRIAELASMDMDETDELLKGLIAEDDFDATLSGFDDDYLNRLLDDGADKGKDAPSALERIAELEEEWKTTTGQLWKLGEHRLMCGNSTNPEAVKALLNGVKPHLMVTDPPYGVNYDPDWRNRAERANGQPYGAASIGLVENDDRALWTDAWSLFPGNIAYVWHGGIHAATVAGSLEQAGFDIRSQIIWAKPSLIISRGHYHWQHEPCWYAVRKGKTGHWAGDRKQSTLWQISHTKSETGHSTQKPIECMRRPMENNSSPGQAVYEPFCGSGTSIIAAEQIGRICYAMELSPGYVAVILQRFLDATGIQPELLR